MKLSKMSRLSVAVVAAALVGPLLMPAAANATVTEDDTTVTINGREYGPEDGVTVVEESFEITDDDTSVGADYRTPQKPGVIGTMADWGSSYARSTEWAYVTYRGVGKAAGNVYAGQRIVKVCFQWSRGGTPVTGIFCSSATSNGSSWKAGPEVVGWATDSLDSNAPSTIFNIKTTRIGTGIY